MSKRKMKDSGVEWLGEIPAEWDVRRGKTFLQLLSRPVKDDDDVVTCFRDGEVTLRKHRREDGFTVALKECGYQGVEPGDLVVHGMDGFAGSIGISDSRGKASPVLNVLDTSEDKRYVMYYLRSLAMRDVFLALSTGIRVRSCDLRWSKLGDIQYLLPPLSTQRKIAAYLDTRCAKIDEMVSDAKKTIEEYKAWKASVIFEAVTGKMEVRRGRLREKSELGESGVEWLGAVPEEWQVCCLKYLCSMQAGKTLSSEEILDEGPYPVYGGNGLRGFYSEFNTSGEYALIGRQGALCGNVHFVDGQFWATEHALVTTPSEKVELPYLYWLLVAMDLNRYVSQTAAQPGLAASVILNVKTVFPPLAEQRTIANFLDKKCAAIDRVVAEKESLVADLEAYKKSLIFECVTGKMEVA